jgi:hypothetical protein
MVKGKRVYVENWVASRFTARDLGRPTCFRHFECPGGASAITDTNDNIMSVAATAEIHLRNHSG